jgi:hypothetical protein
VLIAVFYANHQFHDSSLETFLRFRKNEASCGAHSMAEIYCSLTGRTGGDRVSCDQAMLFIGDVRERLTIVSLDEREYWNALESSAAAGIAGRAIYDAGLGHCAIKARARTLYTWNPKDFTRLGANIAALVKTPLF